MRKVVSLVLVSLLFGVGQVMSAVNEKEKDPVAQYEIGMDYLRERNYSEAYKWFKKSASQKYVDAQFEIGNLYANGNGVKQSDKDAISWYEKAAEQGSNKAKFYLGKTYEKSAASNRKSLENFCHSFYNLEN